MHRLSIESKYPINFRCEDARRLAELIKNHQSVELIGMKRVGISNFLRFFLYHPEIKKKYFGIHYKRYLFIPIDLNDLVECELQPFWLLTFKRVLESIDQTSLPKNISQSINHLFDKAIQLHDLFFTVDALRKTLVELVRHDVYPILFLVRFDRLLDHVTRDFFATIQSLYDTAHGKLAYVFTCYRELSELKPDIFDSNTMSVFSKALYLQPAKTPDTEIICSTFEDRYHIKLDERVKSKLVELSGGHVQYLQLGLAILSEYENKALSPKETEKALKEDERIILQSEELFSTLSQDEKSNLRKISSGEVADIKDLKNEYIWKTGMIANGNRPLHIFSSYLTDYISSQSDLSQEYRDGTYLTNKENALFNLIKSYLGEVCERDMILEQVWSEYESFGVSDWAVDRLIARLRKKLKEMHSPYSIKTIRTRGFMMVKKG